MIISITFNILFLLLGCYVIYKKGGVHFLKRILSSQEEYSNNYLTKKSIFEVMPNGEGEIIFLGNSITDFCDWNELLGKSNIKNRGISGDTINGVIDRIDEVVESKPKKIFLMIGTNDLGNGKSVKNVLSRYKNLVELILQKSPETKLYLQSILPTSNNLHRKNSDIIAINKGIQQFALEYSLTYINLFDLMKTDDNALKTELSFDGLHINGQGYLIWKEELLKHLE
ncbi:GDSL-type esterase/lipase family protein [Flammeovirga sp. SJP92]|uniref:GDSL-type esterase/lipase family protein n=1 Tax=Flammeovirga sp. SJP92 TaxID=1775430 RepID=UPI000786EDFD|nr:GDSL-type esterase/lipase family protein [Flammeovirga sp. SJP92]KXX66628.1 hypothetical protein AVL50_31530 [Flammeovirga sp. SJP92]